MQRFSKLEFRNIEKLAGLEGLKWNSFIPTRISHLCILGNLLLYYKRGLIC